MKERDGRGVTTSYLLQFQSWNEILRMAAIAAFVATATIATVDILLKKSNVASALGWIGLVWLSPFLGAFAYYSFGINRVQRRAMKFDRQPDREYGAIEPDNRMVADGVALLAATASRITGTPLAHGNAICILRGGATAYPQMLAAMTGATQSIALASYIFRADRVGEEFLQALAAAHGRGVQVRVLVDGIGGGYLLASAWRRLIKLGIPAARFLHTWIPWRMPFLNMRNHRKILVVDGQTCFIGGLNIGAEYQDDASTGQGVQDIHFRVEGPVVHQVMDAFARDWAFATDEILDPKLWWPKITDAGKVRARSISSGPDSDIYKIETLLGAALSQARTHIRIVTPYFLPDQRLQFAIGQAVLRGVRVDIVVPDHGDNWLLDWAMQAHMQFFRHAPPNFHLSPPPFDHAKLVTVDGAWCLIGSSNWDVRSLRLNFELDLECYGAPLTAALDDLIDAKIGRARRYVAPTALGIRLRNAAARLLLPYL